MHHAPPTTRSKRTSLIAIGFLLLAAGCGAEGGVPESAEGGLQPGSEGRPVRLERRSTRCQALRSVQQTSLVGPGAEFPAHQVTKLRPPCPDAPNPRIDVHVEEESVLIDFSGVDAPDRFPRGGFEGYVIYFLRDCPDMALSSASLDPDMSRVAQGAPRAWTHFDRLEIDFQGVAYDEGSFIKIDLSSVYVTCAIDI